MTDDGKKVSFGFSKSIKKSTLKIQPPVEEKKVEYIEYVDEESIKIVGKEEKADGPLVIPLLGSKTWHDRILNKTDADIFETRAKNKQNGNTMPIVNGNVRINEDDTLPMDVSKIKKEEPEETDKIPTSLEEQAANEIIADLHGKDVKVEDPNLTVPAAENGALEGTKESTLEDYEEIPIDAFGLAMLRGMGWKPEEGIGKNAKLVTASLPELRPRGMGLGADKVTLQKQKASARSKEEEKLKVEKGSFVKIIAGKFKNNYGQIVCFDDEAGRLMVKMALTGENQSLNECFVQPVTQSDYTKNSKVLNAAKYEEFKTRESNKDGARLATSDSETSDEKDRRKRSGRGGGKDSKSMKNTKKRSSYTSDESSDSDRRSRKRRRNSSESNEDRGHGRVKKSKKSRKRDTSSERSKKSSKRKKNKEREKTRDRKNYSSESTDHKKHKKHKRSRSRSSARR
ncbi:G-patch domain and KOW motifs-containing protein [Venturia canescens]|uniref:G-patch domain and KOW motifs-containing protein n=1 Tax=Venturia canescens TaxID=32260 RepID=UPI001C9CD281|nr:G-patch domain and KOW motifs-containing protein [Venturia canescens]